MFLTVCEIDIKDLIIVRWQLTLFQVTEIDDERIVVMKASFQA